MHIGLPISLHFGPRIVPRSSAPIYGVRWDKSENPTLIRTHDAVGMVANAGVDGQHVQNDFDNAQIYREMGEVTDELGNVFIRIPKFYIRKTDGDGFKTWQISGYLHPGFYLPWCFWDFENERELDYVDIGKYPASLSSDGQRLESKPGVKPLVNTTIVEFRQLARANGKGYQLLDIHAWDVIQCLFWVEFATLNSQSIMMGLVNGTAAATNGATYPRLESRGSIEAGISSMSASWIMWVSTARKPWLN